MTQPHNGQSRSRITKAAALHAASAESSGTHIDSAWFQHKLLSARLSQRRLAKLIGLDPSAVSLMFRGKRRMAADEAAKIARLLNVDVAEVMRHGGIDVRGATTTPQPRFDVAVPLPNPEKIQQELPAEFPNNCDSNNFIEIPVPVSGGFTAILKIPRNFSREDADRIAAIIVAFSQQK